MLDSLFVPPNQLLTPKRLDILFRYRYAQAIINKSSPNWGLTVYREFLEKSNLNCGYSEDGKNSFFDYINAFNNLLHSIQSIGFDPTMSIIKVHGNDLINGAHRTAIGLATGKDIPIMNVATQNPLNYNFHKINSLGLSQNILDDILMSYAELKSGFRYLILIGCDFDTHKSFREFTEHHPAFVGIKTLVLTDIGIRRILKLMYECNEWWNEELLEEFVSLRFDDERATSQATICFFDLPDADEFRILKLGLREAVLKDYKYKRNLHGSDTYQESLLMAQSVLNSNSVFFINNSSIGSESRILKELDKLPISHKERSDLCVSGSSILEAYGLRKAQDIDLVQGTSPIDNEQYLTWIKYSYQHYESTPDYNEMVYDPRHYTYISGYKFLSLHSCLLFKLIRNQKKDEIDTKIIFEFLSANSRQLYSNISTKKLVAQRLRSLLRRFGLERKIFSVFYIIIAKVKR